MTLQNVINSISSAELQAEEKIRIASLKAKEVQLAAEVECERIKDKTSDECKATVKRIMKNAEVAANTKCSQTLNQGAKQAAAFEQACRGRIDDAVDFICGRLISKYVDS